MIRRLNSFFDTIKLYYRFACRRLGVSGYEVHQIYLPEQELLYIPIPKNACTSIKHAMYEIEFGKRFSSELKEKHGYDDHHDYYKKRPGAFTGVAELKMMEQVTRFTVVRDPVERLISCYRNRVLDLGDLRSSVFILNHMNLSPKPDINTFILNLEGYRKANKSIEHHSRPQHEFLGGTIQYLDHVFPIENLDELEGMLKNYKPDLEMLKRKSGGSDIDLSDISEKALQKAIEFYHNDYKLLESFYKPEKIREKYRKQTESSGE